MARYLKESMSELKKVEDWKTLNSTFNLKYRKIGRMVEIDMNVTKNYSTNTPITLAGYTNILLGTLPEKYRPDSEVVVAPYVQAKRDVRLTINTNGEVYLFNWQDTTTTDLIATHLIYFV